MKKILALALLVATSSGLADVIGLVDTSTGTAVDIVSPTAGTPYVIQDEAWVSLEFVDVDLTTDVTGTLPIANGGTGGATAADARTQLNVDVAGTDNSTPVSLVTTAHDYLSITGQSITLGAVTIADDMSDAAYDDDNLFIGHSGYSGVSGTDYYNLYNVGIGYQTLITAETANAAGLDGDRNVAIGYQAGTNNTTGKYNIFLNYQAGYLNTTGYDNFFAGNRVGYANTTGYSNLAIGDRALFDNTTGSKNVFLGSQAGTNNTTGAQNLGMGVYAGTGNTTGSNNFFFGYQAGRYQADGSSELQTPENSLYIGVNTRSGSDSAGGEDPVLREMVIGYGTTGRGSDTTVVGSTTTNLTHIYGALSGTELSADPPDPAEGEHVCWQSDGSASGDDGDIVCKITANSTTTTFLLVDLSVAPPL